MHTCFDAVELMHIANKQWFKSYALPMKCSEMSATVHENTLYLAGGTTEKPEGGFTSSTSVIKCSLPDLWSGYRKFLKQRWIDVYSLPVKRSTLVSFGGELLAIGGRGDLHHPTSGVYKYNSKTNSWTVTSQLNTKRSACFAVSLIDRLAVFGGFTERKVDGKTNSVELFN